MTAAVKIDTSVLERMAKNLSSNVVAVGLSMAYMIEANAKPRIHKVTGALANSINVYNIRRVPFYCRIGPHMDYALAVEYGTAPHDIYPTNKKALYWKGAAHPVKVVHHPGTPAKPYLTPAVEFVRWKFENASTWKDVLK